MRFQFHDNIYVLLSVTQSSSTTESYTYDPVGNRLTDLGSAYWTYNSSNELTARPSVTYTFDNNGNTLTMVNASGTTTYSWDFENRLTTAALPGSGGTVTFKYDPFGRRIYKSSSIATSVYAYDGDNLIEETNSSGTAVARYSQGLNIDEPLAMLRSSTTSYYQADGHRGMDTPDSQTPGSRGAWKQGVTGRVSQNSKLHRQLAYRRENIYAATTARRSAHDDRLCLVAAKGHKNTSNYCGWHCSVSTRSRSSLC